MIRYLGCFYFLCIVSILLRQKWQPDERFEQECYVYSIQFAKFAKQGHVWEREYDNLSVCGGWHEAAYGS